MVILLGVALIGSMYLFQHLLLESRTGLKAPSGFTFKETVRALAIAAGSATFLVIFVCAVSSINLSFKIAGWTDVLFVSILSLWFLLPLIAYATLFVRDRNRILNPGVR